MAYELTDRESVTVIAALKLLEEIRDKGEYDMSHLELGDNPLDSGAVDDLCADIRNSLPYPAAPRELTDREVRDKFLAHVWEMIGYWEPRPGGVEGIAFSILCAIDGDAAALPKFALCPDPHPEDKPYSIEKGDSYYPAFLASRTDACDIAGSLHELFYNAKPKGR